MLGATLANAGRAHEAAAAYLKALDAKHPEYTANARAWEDLGLLYCGGHALKAQASRFLVKRPKELSDVYSARLQRFTYQNILGTALGWYQAAMFETDPDIIVKREGGDANEEEQAFYSRFLNDCDKGGTSFVDLYRRVFLSCRC